MEKNIEAKATDEVKREDLNGDENIAQAKGEEIPVVVQGASDAALLPKKNEEEDEFVVKFRKPFNFEGDVFTELDLHGLEDLRGRDLTAIEKAFNKTGVSSFVPESTTTYAKIVATKVTGLPAEYFEDLPVGEVEKIKNAVVGFFYKDE